MKPILFSIIVLLVSCTGKNSLNNNQAAEITEYDSSFWQATELVWTGDTIQLNLDYLIFNIQDTFVHKWYFRNDTLKNLTQSNFCKCFIEALDTIVFPITCKNYWYDIGDEYTLENDHGIINRVHIVLNNSDDTTDPKNQYLMDSAHIVIRRKLITTSQSKYLYQLNNLSMDTLMVLH